ncbi:MAG: hypothetical protein R3B72_35085 [Polyangiaceae bacterium]
MAWMMGALVVTALSGNVYAQTAEEPSKNKGTEELEASPNADDPEEVSLDDASMKERQVAQVRPAGARTGNLAAAEEDEEDKVEEEEELPDKIPARVPWRGTAASWGHNATATAIGWGKDYQSKAYLNYNQTFNLGLNYFVIDKPKWSLAVAAAPSVGVELTNSNSTTLLHEPQFQDLPTSVVYRRTLYSHDELPIATGLVLNGTVLWGTSPQSLGTGTYFNTSPRLTVWQALPLLPKDASPVLNSIVIGGSFRWDHRFGKAAYPVNDELDRPRMNTNNEPIVSDVLAFNRLAPDALRQSVFLFMQENFGPTQLVLVSGFGFSQSYRGTPSNGNDGVPDVCITTGCISEEEIDANGLEDKTSIDFGYSFFVQAQFFPMAEWGLSAFYANAVNQLGPDGRRQNVFGSPQGGQVGASLIVSFDAIYEGIIGPRRNSPFVLVAKNDKKKRRDDRDEKVQDKLATTGL